MVELPVAPARVAAGRIAGRTRRCRPRRAPAADPDPGRRAGRDRARSLFPGQPGRHARRDPAGLPATGPRPRATRRRRRDVVGLHSRHAAEDVRPRSGAGAPGAARRARVGDTRPGGARAAGRLRPVHRHAGRTQESGRGARRLRAAGRPDAPPAPAGGGGWHRPGRRRLAGADAPGAAERIRQLPGLRPGRRSRGAVRRRPRGGAAVVGRRFRPAGARGDGRRHSRRGLEPRRAARGGRNSRRDRGPGGSAGVGGRDRTSGARRGLGAGSGHGGSRSRRGLLPGGTRPRPCARPTRRPCSAGGSAPDADRHRRARADGPCHRRRPLPGGAAQGLERRARGTRTRVRAPGPPATGRSAAAEPAPRHRGPSGRRGHPVGAAGVAEAGAPGPCGRAVRAGLYRSADLAGAGGRDHPRRVVLRAPRVVLVARRVAPAPADATLGARRGPGAPRSPSSRATKSCGSWACPPRGCR